MTKVKMLIFMFGEILNTIATRINVKSYTEMSENVRFLVLSSTVTRIFDFSFVVYFVKYGH